MPSSLLLDEAFGASADLTSAINDLAVPNEPIIHRIVPFEESGITTTSAVLEREGDTVQFLPTTPRGGVGQPYQGPVRDGIKVNTLHIPHSGSVLADEVQDMREFGKTTVGSPKALRDKKLAGMKRNILYTEAMHKLGAIKGLVLDADGSTLLDVYALYGVAQQTVNFALDTANNLTVKAITAQRMSEDALGGATPTGYVAVASRSFMDALRQNGYYEKVLQYATPSKFMEDFRTGIVIGDTTFVELRAAGPVAIEEGTAYMVPDGIDGLLIGRYAPADYNDTVNTEGLPMYARAEEMPMGKGYVLEAQSNPFFLCTRPRSIIKITATANP